MSEETSKAPPTSDPEAGATPETVHQQLWRVSKERDAALARVAELESLYKKWQLRAHDYSGRIGELASHNEALRVQAASDAKEIAELKAACATMRGELEKRALLADSYGEPGSTFYVCDICKGESGAGVLNEGVEHEPGCILATDSGKAYADRLAAAEADTMLLDWVETNRIGLVPCFGKTPPMGSNLPIPFEGFVIDSNITGVAHPLRETIYAAIAMQKGTTNES